MQVPQAYSSKPMLRNYAIYFSNENTTASKLELMWDNYLPVSDTTTLLSVKIQHTGYMQPCMFVLATLQPDTPPVSMLNNCYESRALFIHDA